MAESFSHLRMMPDHLFSVGTEIGAASAKVDGKRAPLPFRQA
jgi:hypothetical protein